MYSVGMVIKNEREKRGISQKELCSGICALSSLSRIENNEQVPSMDKALALLERLGLEGSSYINFVSEEEYNYYRIRESIEKSLAKRKYTEAYDMMCENKVYFLKNSFREQCMLVIKALNYCMVKQEYETAIKIAEEAIRYTCPNFDEKKEIRNLLSDTEIHAINIIAVSHWKNNNKLIAVLIMSNLIEAIRNISEFTEKRKQVYPILLCNYAKWLCIINRIAESEKIIMEGIENCIYSNKFRMLPFFLCCKSEIMTRQNANIESVLDNYLNAYILFRNMGMSEDADMLCNYVVEKYKRNLKKLIISEI